MITLYGEYLTGAWIFICWQALALCSSHIKFSPNSKYILASTQDSTIRLWNIQSSRCVKTYTGHTNRTYSLFCDFAPGGLHIVSGSEDAKVYLWHLQDRQVVQVLEGHRGATYSGITMRDTHLLFHRCCHRTGRMFYLLNSRFEANSSLE